MRGNRWVTPHKKTQQICLNGNVLVFDNKKKELEEALALITNQGKKSKPQGLTMEDVIQSNRSAAHKSQKRMLLV